MTNKFYIKNTINKYGYVNLQKTLHLKKAIETYINGLIGLGFNVEKKTKLRIVSNKGKYFIELIQPNYTESLEGVLENLDIKAYLILISKLLSLLEVIVKQKNIVYSIDPKPSNFVLKGENLLYVDFLPPLINQKKFEDLIKRKDESNQKISWKKKRYFETKGLLQVFVVRVLIIQPKYSKQIVRLAINFINNLQADLRGQIKDSKFYKVLLSISNGRKTDVANIITKLSTADRDLLRIIYLCFGLEKHSYGKCQINNFLKYSKNSKNVENIKNQLINSLRPKK